MDRTYTCIVLAVVLALPMVALAEQDPSETWLTMAEAKVDTPAADADKPAADADADADAPAPAGKLPPLPLHTIEGVGGVLITPTAYLVNPGPEGTKIGMPSVSLSYVNIGKKSIQAFAVTQTFFRRFEIGYAINRFDLGTLGDAVKKALGASMREDVYLHHFNFRALLIEENSFDLPLPAITAGAHLKINSGISSINSELGRALESIGYDSPCGVDFTLTASKTFAKLAFGRPVIVSVGLRNSRAHQIGYLGFADHCETTVEGNVICLLTDRLALAYEFRQKANPYHKIHGLIGDEDNWHTIALGYVVNNHLTISGGYGKFGTVFNSTEDCGWALQIKYEF